MGGTGPGLAANQPISAQVVRCWGLLLLLFLFFPIVFFFFLKNLLNCCLTMQIALTPLHDLFTLFVMERGCVKHF